MLKRMNGLVMALFKVVRSSTDWLPPSDAARSDCVSFSARRCGMGGLKGGGGSLAMPRRRPDAR